MSDEYDDNDEEPKGRRLDVHVFKESNNEDEPNYRQMLEKIALAELETRRQQAIELAPDKEDEIREMGPYELDGFLEGYGKGKGKKASTGVVSLHRGEPQNDVVSDVFNSSYENPSEMLSELYELGNRMDLTPTQKRRIENAKDVLWDKLNRSPTQNTRMVLTRKGPQLKEGEYSMLCAVCGNEIPVNEYDNHYAQHQKQHREAKRVTYEKGLE